MNRSLRPRKSINYLEIVQDKSSLNANGHFSSRRSSNTSISNISGQEADEAKVSEHDSEENVSSDNSDSKSETGSEEDGYSSKKKKRKLNISVASSTSYLAILAENENDDDEDDEYKLQREKNMRDRENVLKAMDLDDEINELGIKVVASPFRAPVIPARRRSQPVRRSQKSSSTRSNKSAENENLRKSMRIVTRSFTLSNPNYVDDLITNGAGQDKRDKVVEEDFDLVNGDDDEDFFENIKELPNISYDSISDFVSCDYDKFSEIVKSCQMHQEPKKIISSRITSLDFHRSESKLLLVCGDKHGHVSLWDVEMNKGITSKPHGYSTNCVSFSRDGTKFYSTALDGTTRVGDIELRSSMLLHKTVDDEGGDESHTTWHHEFGQQLLIARGDGSVILLDLRAPKENPSIYKCHKRSVRTVQVNPENDNYFLTSSGVGEFGIWDLRQSGSKQKRIENLGKALTSAFYSAKGSYVLTTSNDDTIRIYDCRGNETKEQTVIPHNNHVGRWLSVLKARWQPQREDCFYVGSMLTKPKRIQAYTINGKILHEFSSPMMDTHSTVVAVHPTKPIIVGGNASGRIHVYSPFTDLQSQVF